MPLYCCCAGRMVLWQLPALCAVVHAKRAVFSHFARHHLARHASNMVYSSMRRLRLRQGLTLAVILRLF